MHIFVLQSLKKNDPKTGEQIHEYLKTENIPNEFHYFKSKEQLLNLLELVKVKAATGNLQPFIHLDCHGNDQGIGAVASDENVEMITWDDILDKSIEIYRSSNKKLVICMSSCNGLNAGRMVAKGKACPYDYVCGSLKKITFKDSFAAFKIFYQKVNEGVEINSVVETINHVPELENMEFKGIDSITLFNMAINGYIADELTESSLKRRRSFLLTELLKTDPNPTKEQMSYLDHVCSVPGQQEILERYRNTFFS